MKNLSFVVIAFLLAACGGNVKEAIGLQRNVPDEFAVEKRPMLDVPPQFKLRPPAPGQVSLGQTEIREVARSTILSPKKGAGTLKLSTKAEDLLLKKTGAAKANPKIREILNSEYGTEEPDLLDRIESISDDTKNKTLVDPAKERERIAKNKKAGKPVNEGESATKSKSGSLSVIDKIIGE